MKDQIFLVVKDIPLVNGGRIPKDMHIHLANGIFYSEFGPFDTSMQLAWRELLQRKDWTDFLKVVQS